MEKKILITCFEPFGGESFNASMAVAEAMPVKLAGADVEKVTLPVEFGRAAVIAREKAKETGASLVICFGEARSRKAVTPELLAINLAHASIPDNAGNLPHDEIISENGETAYFTDFPARNLAEAIKKQGVASLLSYSAGAYVCNDLYYRLLYSFNGSGTRVLFIHVPRLDIDGGYAAMANAVALALSSIICEEPGDENVKK